MTPTIMHVNLAKGFRGGERQTELLIKELAKHDLKQYLVCRDNSPLREHLKTVSNLEFITANHQLMGHFAVHQKIDMIHAHEAKSSIHQHLNHDGFDGWLAKNGTNGDQSPR